MSQISVFSYLKIHTHKKYMCNHRRVYTDCRDMLVFIIDQHIKLVKVLVEVLSSLSNFTNLTHIIILLEIEHFHHLKQPRMHSFALNLVFYIFKFLNEIFSINYFTFCCKYNKTKEQHE
jgi:hypothetical protein